MKVAPVMRALAMHPGVEQMLVHTGQHYDANMNEVFFRQLDLPTPDLNLGIGSGSHAVQTAQTMMGVEKVMLDHAPDLVLVYGDVNSTVAAALVCAKLLAPVAHVEAGLRSFDRTMPEEINRLLTDQIADLLFTPSADGDANLLREGVAADRIHLVGNVMVDTLVRLLPRAESRWDDERLRAWRGQRYALVTLHRPSNVDDPAILSQIIDALVEISRTLPVIFPVHPRTRQRLRDFDAGPDGASLHLIEPLGYLDFLALQAHATVVITDSGGVQEETTYLGVPCLTVRENTERPITVTMGTNTLVGQDMGRLQAEVDAILTGMSPQHIPSSLVGPTDPMEHAMLPHRPLSHGRQSRIPPLWDGKAGERIAAVVAARL